MTNSLSDHAAVTTTAGRSEIAFRGDTPWHGLGQRISDTASIEEAGQAAGFNWTVDMAPMLYQTEVIDPDTRTLTVETLAAKGRVILHRSDTKAVLGVASHRYRPVHPMDTLEFFREVVESGGGQIETAGTLHGGARLWALARLAGGFELPGGDEVNPYFLLSTGTDGGMSTQLRETAIRVVCQNTFSAATGGAAMVSVKHSSHFDVDKVRLKFAAASRRFESMSLTAHAMAKARMSEGLVHHALSRIMPMPFGDHPKPVEETKGYQQVMALFHGAGRGAELPSAEGTAWGLFNAVTEWVDYHGTARTADNRLNSAWFGPGQEIKIRALDVLRVMV